MQALFNRKKGPMRVMGFCSGSGATLWKTLELQRELEACPEGSPFQVVGAFTGNKNAKAIVRAKEEGIPIYTLDMREFYEKHDKPLNDMETRRAFDAAVYEMIREARADVILLAGYVWAITEPILDNYLMVNVHPGDLSVEKDGERILAGANGVKSAFEHRMNDIAASSHLVNSGLDQGPILMISESIPIDYALHTEEEARFRYYLKLINAQNRLLGARTILEIAQGNFARDGNGRYYYRGKAVPKGVKISSWEQYKPRPLLSADCLLSPHTVAVVGASRSKGLGYKILTNILETGFTGELYAVNRQGESVEEVPGYKAIAEIPERIDLAVLAVPSGAIEAVIEECGEHGVRALICVTAGFAETGEEGRQAQRRIDDLLHKYNMRMLGPNCMGAMNLTEDIRLGATILQSTPKEGGIAFVTQSGAIGATYVDYSERLNIGFSVIVSLGNQADITVCDILPLLNDNPKTKVVLLYLETIPEPDRFRKIMQTMQKPVIIVKSGRSEAGAKAAGSHTASLAGDEVITDAFLTQCGVIRVDQLRTAFQMADTLSKVQPPKGNRVGVVTNAGGPGILIMDSLSAKGFEMPALTQEQVERLAPKLLKEASIANPIDLVATATPEHYADAVEEMLRSEIDALVVNCVPPANVDTYAIAKRILPILKTAEIPSYTCFMGPTLGGEATALFRKEGIPAFDFPDEIAASIRRKNPNVSVAYPFEPLRKPEGAEIHSFLHRAEKGDYLPQAQVMELLDLYGIPRVKEVYIPVDEEPVLDKLPFPMVAKAVVPDMTHKSDKGGVVLNIGSMEELKNLLARWKKDFTDLEGVIVQTQIASGLELAFGLDNDPVYGLNLMFGMGGTAIDVIGDVQFRNTPLTANDAAGMVEGIKAYPLLTGYRGTAAADQSTLYGIIASLNQMALDMPSLQELDINPMIVDAKTGSLVAVDCRVLISAE